MRQVLWASVATSTPMGQQRYEHEIQAALRRVAGNAWNLEARTVSSMRGVDGADRRVPSRLNRSVSLTANRALGRLTYGTPDLVHRFDLRLPAAWGREVVTVHDLPPCRFPDEGAMNRSSAAGARRAGAVIAPSHFAADELRELLGVTDVDVIPYGLSSEYRDAQPAQDSSLKAHGIDRPFILHAAGASARKNLAGLKEAWTLLLAEYPDVQLVLCGPADDRRTRLFAGLPRVVMTGRLESNVVASLMRRALAVVVPSIYEGFGLPALEGMAAGAPVVAARRGALPEVCDDAALLVEPDGSSIADGVARLVADADLRQDLVARGLARSARFDWDDAAREHLRVYERIAD